MQDNIGLIPCTWSLGLVCIFLLFMSNVDLLIQFLNFYSMCLFTFYLAMS